LQLRRAPVLVREFVSALLRDAALMRVCLRHACTSIHLRCLFSARLHTINETQTLTLSACA